MYGGVSRDMRDTQGHVGGFQWTQGLERYGEGSQGVQEGLEGWREVPRDTRWGGLEGKEGVARDMGRVSRDVVGALKGHGGVSRGTGGSPGMGGQISRNMGVSPETWGGSQRTQWGP